MPYAPRDGFHGLFINFFGYLNFVLLQNIYFEKTFNEKQLNQISWREKQKTKKKNRQKFGAFISFVIPWLENSTWLEMYTECTHRYGRTLAHSAYLLPRRRVAYVKNDISKNWGPMEMFLSTMARLKFRQWTLQSITKFHGHQLIENTLP